MASQYLGSQINLNKEKEEGRIGVMLNCESRRQQMKEWEKTGGDCVEANFKKYWELGTKFGFENFQMLEQQTFNLDEEGFDGVKKEQGENFVIHHLIWNTKLNLIMDYSNGRTIMVDKDEYCKNFNCSAYYKALTGKGLYKRSLFWVALIGGEDYVNQYDCDDECVASMLFITYWCHHAFQTWWRREGNKEPNHYKNENDVKAFLNSEGGIGGGFKSGSSHKEQIKDLMDEIIIKKKVCLR